MATPEELSEGLDKAKSYHDELFEEMSARKSNKVFSGGAPFSCIYS